MHDHCYHVIATESSFMPLFDEYQKALVTTSFKICCHCGNRIRSDEVRYIPEDERPQPTPGHGPYWRENDTE